MTKARDCNLTLFIHHIVSQRNTLAKIVRLSIDVDNATLPNLLHEELLKWSV